MDLPDEARRLELNDDRRRLFVVNGPIAFVCECGSAECTSLLGLSLGEYERARSVPTQFIVRPGHETPHVEQVVERSDRYHVVRKHSDESHIAIETDPRG